VRPFKKVLWSIGVLLFSTQCTVSHRPVAGRDLAAEEKAIKACDLETLRKFPTNAAFAGYAHCVVLRRAPSPQELEKTVEDLKRTGDRMGIFSLLATSTEFKSAAGTEPFVSFSYDRLLGRKPTAEELSLWRRRDELEKLTPDRIAVEVIAMREARERHGI
jgi:hypothetical protein